MNIKETKELLKYLPSNQALMLKGIHGIGKSVFIKEYFEEQGYNVHVFFGATAADAGDIIGLPDIEVMTKVDSEGNEYTYKHTIFNPPQWWPTDPNEKVVVFLDEANRAKPDIQNCFMDMILNRKLNGRELGENVRIVAGINPSDTGFYEVHQSDPAFMDRFVVVDFTPSVEEWVDYAMSRDVHSLVVDFIRTNAAMLDPDISKVVELQPSRRSWVACGKFFDSIETINNTSILDDGGSLKESYSQACSNYIRSKMGDVASATFNRFCKSRKRSVSAEDILTGDHDKVSTVISKLTTSEICYVNLEVYYWLQRNTAKWGSKGNYQDKVINNLLKYIQSINKELALHLLDKMIVEWNNSKAEKVNGRNWVEIILKAKSEFTTLVSDMIRGK